MTPHQITLVQTSFAKVVPIAATAADLFYRRLFEIAPDVRGMFPDDVAEQKKKLKRKAVTTASMSATTSPIKVAPLVQSMPSCDQRNSALATSRA